MTKRIIRIATAVIGAGIGAGILALLVGALRGLNLFDFSTQIVPWAQAVIYAAIALGSALIFYIIEPKLFASVGRGMKQIETQLAQMPIQDIIAGIIGLLVGLIIALLLSSIIRLIPIPWLSVTLSVVLYITLGYLGVAVGVNRRNDLSLPRILQNTEENAKRNNDRINRHIAPKVLDTSVIIDGRIYDIAKTGVIEGRLVVPSFVLQELRHIADSSDALRRQRGRRGLDILNAMQTELNTIQVVDKDYEGVEVDEKLILLANEMKGKIVTNDFNLNKVATVKGVEVLNINQLANALKPAVLPGEEMHIQIIKDGKEQGQGVGYLDDGTMIVVDGGKRHVGKSIDVQVTSVLQTSAGRMVFAKAVGKSKAG